MFEEYLQFFHCCLGRGVVGLVLYYFIVLLKKKNRFLSMQHFRAVGLLCFLPSCAALKR